ncbi:hypothetical protein [Microbacterium sp. BR1]|uniref:hypothetical protein n=1 Tax=Microbacterium sp. BR1 TaxID=1070896 RepID=UPI000C2B760A|nr:hypothetical protein [Microbacterium sp. BR1]
MKRVAGAGVLALIGVALVGCGVSVESVAETCGGETAGVTVTGDVLEYDESRDSTGDAWMCLLDEFVPDDTDQYTVTQSLTGAANDARFGEYTVVWGVNSRGVQMSFWRTLD